MKSLPRGASSSVPVTAGGAARPGRKLRLPTVPFPPATCRPHPRARPISNGICRVRAAKCLSPSRRKANSAPVRRPPSSLAPSAKRWERRESFSARSAPDCSPASVDPRQEPHRSAGGQEAAALAAPPACGNLSSAANPKPGSGASIGPCARIYRTNPFPRLNTNPFKHLRRLRTNPFPRWKAPLPARRSFSSVSSPHASAGAPLGPAAPSGNPVRSKPCARIHRTNPFLPLNSNLVNYLPISKRTGFPPATRPPLASAKSHAPRPAPSLAPPIGPPLLSRVLSAKPLRPGAEKALLGALPARSTLNWESH